MTARRWLERIQSRFLRLVDSEEIRLFQGLIYASVLAAGTYMVFYGSPTTVRDELGDTMNTVWVSLTLLGPALTGAGNAMVVSGQRRVMHSEKRGGGGRVYWGWYLQTGGDIAIGMMFLAYVIAAFSSAWLTKGIFAAFVISSLILCAAILVVRDIRRISAIERM